MSIKIRACNSVGQSTPLITGESLVRVQVGPPIFRSVMNLRFQIVHTDGKHDTLKPILPKMDPILEEAYVDAMVRMKRAKPKSAFTHLKTILQKEKDPS